MADEPGRDVPEPVTERVRFCAGQVALAMEAKESAPGLQVRGDVRGDGPAAVDPPRFRGKIAQADGLAGADAVPNDSVLAVQDAGKLGVPTPGNAFQSFPGDVRADNRVLPAGLLLIGGDYLQP